jgi:hypothetical protein
MDHVSSLLGLLGAAASAWAAYVSLLAVVISRRPPPKEK